ncbi:kelch repeat-containing protein [Hymenobacter ruber]
MKCLLPLGAFLLLTLPQASAQTTPAAGGQGRTSSMTAWTFVTSTPQVHIGGAIEGLPNGRLYVWGGTKDPNCSLCPTTSNALEVYDPAANTWTTGAPLPGVSISRQGHAVDANGLLYSIRGSNPSPVVLNWGIDYKYSSVTNSWTALSFNPANGINAAAAAAANGNIHFMGGGDGNSGNVYYNPAVNRWLPAAQMTNGRYGHVTVTDANGRIHAIGGRNDDVYPAQVLTSHEVYSPAANTWTAAAPLPAGVYMAGGVLGADGNIYVIGGKTLIPNAGVTDVRTVYVYDPAANTWSTGASLPVSQGGEVVATRLGNDIYCFKYVSVFRSTIASGPLANSTGAQQSDALQLYPNPASTASVEVVASGFSGAENTAEVTLVNNLGQRVRQFTAAVAGHELRTATPVADLARGLYTLQVHSGSRVFTRRLVLQ